MMTKRSAPLVLSLVFLLSSLALWNQVNLYFTTTPLVESCRLVQETPSKACLAGTENQAVEVEGVWEQYSVEGDQRYFMARLDVRKDGADYLATPVVISEDCFPKHAYRSYDHVINNGVWTFREQWDGGEVGEFVLERQSNGEYLGTARHAECDEGFETVYVRVAD